MNGWGPVLSPDGAAARADAPLAWVLLAGGLAVTLFVLALGAYAVRRGPRTLRRRHWLLGGGLVFPGAVLAALAVQNLRDVERLHAPAPADAWVAGVQGRMWWWQVRVADPEGGRDLVLANELVLPVGRPVRVALESADAIHSLWVPALAGKVDLVPGRVRHLVLQADRTGQWRGPCAEFCGSGHAAMVLHVRALPPAAFDAWRARERQPARAPTTPQQQAGRAHFVAHGCANCHAVRGVTQPVLGTGELAGHGGPDLTHVASRAWLGAGVLPNGEASLRRWLTDVQQLKPGARMPAYGHLDAATLDALAAWLASLE